MRRYFLYLILFFSANSLAHDYFTYNSQLYSSLISACNVSAARATQGGTSSGGWVSSNHPDFYDCNVTRPDGSTTMTIMQVMGQFCPVGHVFDPELKQCVIPPPPPKCGREYRSFTYTLKYPLQGSYCSFGCQFDVQSSTSEEYKDVWISSGMARNTGMECSIDTENVSPNEDLQECPAGFPDAYCYPPTLHPDPEKDEPSCGNGVLVQGIDGAFCAVEKDQYESQDPTNPDNAPPKFPDPKPDTGGSGGDGGSGEPDLPTPLNCPTGYTSELLNGVQQCVKTVEGGQSCPIGTTQGTMQNEGTCVPDDCAAGHYMTPQGCLPIPDTKPNKNDSNDIVAAIRKQTFDLSKNNTDTVKAGTLSIIQNDNKIVRSQNEKLETETDRLIQSINNGSGDIVTALTGVKNAIDDKQFTGGGGGTNPDPDPEEPEEPEEPTGGIGGTVQTEYSSFAEVNSAFFAKLQASPLGQAGQSLPVMFSNGGSGSCPNFTIALPMPINKTVSTVLHCSLMEQITPALSALMLIIFSFYGFRILFSA